jgi:hypothetical protein
MHVPPEMQPLPISKKRSPTKHLCRKATRISSISRLEPSKEEPIVLVVGQALFLRRGSGHHLLRGDALLDLLDLLALSVERLALKLQHKEALFSLYL